MLAGGGPADVVDLTIALAETMCELSGVDADPAAVLASGAAMDVWNKMVAAQGGDHTATLRRAHQIEQIRATETGRLSALDARKIGEAAWRLGAGRARKEDSVSEAAGVVWHAIPGDEVTKGHVLFELHADDADRIPPAVEAIQGAERYGDTLEDDHPLILERIG